ncbi:hypothetical protein [Demequina sp.]|uniref:hypothetical protein n=1 Tax=Demequina sp. TaxID=2050685 RepID=UPI003A89D6BB
MDHVDHGDVQGAVELTDDSEQLRVRVEGDGTAQLELGIGAKATFEPMKFAGEVQILVNRALGEQVSRTLSRHWKAVAASASRRREDAGLSEPVEARLEAILERTHAMRERAQELRTRDRHHEAIEAGRRDRVWVEARSGFVSAFSVDEGFYSSCPLAALQDEINDALAQALAPSARLDGPLTGLMNRPQEDHS